MAKQPGRYQKHPVCTSKTVFYQRKLMKDAGTNESEATKIAMDRKEWRLRITQEMEHLENWERHQASFLKGPKILLPPANPQCYQRGKLCKSVDGLKNHIKRKHRGATHLFKCNPCDKT